MCGIVGLSSRSRVDPEALDAAIAAIAHRGPDGHGAFLSDDGLTALGHTRLAIIDLSPAGAQPMSSHDGRFVTVFNGEIYNYRDLKRELEARGVRFRGGSDTEVVLEGFALDGPAYLSRLNGIAAIAIYDTRERQLFLARDNLGIKPLYYAETPEGLAFGSEIKPLLELVAVERALDVSAVAKYATFLWCPGEQTPFAGVKKLDPGSAIIVKDGAVTRRWRWWSPPPYAPRTDWTAETCASELRATLEASVDRQMVADVPVGAFLSGGLDSTAVVAAARARGHGIDCFTINTSGAEGGATDDLPYAREAAAHLGVRLHEVKVDAAALCDGLVEMVGQLDEPLADPACLNVLHISRLAREHGMKVLLSGTGGDDLFAGYRRHAAVALDPLWSAVPGLVRRGLAGMASGGAGGSALRRRVAKALAAAAQDGDRRIASVFAWGPLGGVEQLLAAEHRHAARPDEIFAPMDAVLAGVAGEPAVERCLALDQRFFLADHNLIYTDKMAMAAGVEVRVPLIDLEMVDFAARTPTAWKLRGGVGKWILKQSQRGVLPDRIIDRPKSGFGAPLRLWMKGPMREATEDLLSETTLRSRGLFDPAAVARLRAADASGAADGSYTLFSLMCVELWCRRFLDSSATPVRRGAPRRAVSA